MNPFEMSGLELVQAMVEGKHDVHRQGTEALHRDDVRGDVRPRQLVEQLLSR
jgi:hypothetical protein